MKQTYQKLGIELYEFNSEDVVKTSAAENVADGVGIKWSADKWGHELVSND